MNSTIFYQNSHNHHKGRISIKLGKKHRSCILGEHIAWSHSMCHGKHGSIHFKWLSSVFSKIITKTLYLLSKCYFPCLYQNHWPLPAVTAVTPNGRRNLWPKRGSSCYLFPNWGSSCYLPQPRLSRPSLLLPALFLYSSSHNWVRKCLGSYPLLTKHFLTLY